MPVATVNHDTGAVLYYEDSGAPEGATTYLTVVVVHGFMYHSAVFSRLVPYATERQVRLIRVNLRDYPGSSGFSPEELEPFRGDVKAQEDAVAALGRELVAFLEHIIKELNLPAVTLEDGRRSGGMAVMAWSYGNVVLMSMLAHAEWWSAETKNLLRRYIRTVVLYEPSVTTLGVTPINDVYHPLRDKSLNTQQFGARFAEWITWYSDPIDDLDHITAEALAARKPRHDPNVLLIRRIDPTRTPTLLRMTLEELAACTNHDILERSFPSMRQVRPQVYAENTRKALLDTGHALPDVAALVIWGDMSMSDCLWSVKNLADQARTSKAKGSNTREIKFTKIAGANHFVHWDDPKTFMHVLLAGLS